MPPLPRRFRWLRRRLLIGGLFACATAGAQILPDAPIVNFRIPMFNDAGQLVWELRSSEGIYASGNRARVKQMRLQVFDEDAAARRVELEISSPSGTVLIQDKVAHGDESITVVGDSFIIEGERWQWHADEKRVVIDENVKVTFFEELSGLLP